MPFLRSVLTVAAAVSLGAPCLAADDSSKPVYRAWTVCGFSQPAPRPVVYALDAISGDPFPGVEVLVEGPETPPRKAMTDAHGRAVLLDFGAGRLDVKISLNGFVPVRTQVDVGRECLAALTAPLHGARGGHM